MHSCTLCKWNCNVTLVLALVLRCSGLSLSLTMSSGPKQTRAAFSRTGFLKAAAATLVGAGLGIGAVGQPIEKVHAVEPLVETYWGNGCFWHVQHEMIKAEMSILGRSKDELTAYAGYAGARRAPGDGKLCYHNRKGTGDYGKAGAAEVVSVMIPKSKVPEFASAYFEMFVRYDNGAGRVFIDRRDTQDRGGEYRSLLGVPGGLDGAMANPIKEEAAKRGLALQGGVGGDPDTLMRNKVFVMDTGDFPFYKGELYHQFHNDMTEDYGRQYNALREKYAEEGKMEETGCPERGFLFGF